MEVVVTTESIKCTNLQSPPTNQHSASNRLDAVPATELTVSEHWSKGVSVTFHGWRIWSPQVHVGVFKPCFWPLKVPSYLGRVVKPLVSPLMPVMSCQVVITKLVPAVDAATNSLHWLLSPAVAWSDTRCLPVVMSYLEIPDLCKSSSTQSIQRFFGLPRDRLLLGSHLNTCFTVLWHGRCSRHSINMLPSLSCERCFDQRLRNKLWQKIMSAGWHRAKYSSMLEPTI